METDYPKATAFADDEELGEVLNYLNAVELMLAYYPNCWLELIDLHMKIEEIKEQIQEELANRCPTEEVEG